MVFSSNNLPYSLKTGIQNLNPKSLSSQFRNALEFKYDYYITSIFDNRSSETAKSDPEINKLLSKNKQDFNKLIVCQSFELDYSTVQVSELQDINAIIAEQIKYCHHLNIKAYILQLPNTDSPEILDLFIQNLYTIIESVQSQIEIYIKVGLNRQSLKRYRMFQLGFGYDKLVFPIVLEIPLNMESHTESTLKEFYSENIKIIQYQENHFISNEQNLPVLTQKFKQLLEQQFKYNNPSICVNVELQRNVIKDYKQYICWVFQKMPVLNLLDDLTSDLEDQLQEPLQPSIDDLEDQVYHAFEKDIVKYQKYYEAMKQAILKKSGYQDYEWTIFYVGCGRGGILEGILRLEKELKLRLKVLLIEKNKFILKQLKYVLKAVNNVMILETDIRDYKKNVEKSGLDIKLKADLVVSELLGGFGDNELAPELMMEMQLSMLKQDGIMIPQSYSSYTAILYSPLAYNRVLYYNNHIYQKENLHKNYCVKLKRHHLLCREIQKAWTFDHSQVLTNPVSLNKYSSLVFKVNREGVLHGIVGYFDCQLSDSVVISTVPGKETKDMLGWFPILFPFETLVYCYRDWEVKVSIWRECTESKVYYMWKYLILDQDGNMFYNSKLHNYAGQALSILKTT